MSLNIVDLEAKFKAFSDSIGIRLDRIEKSIDKKKDETDNRFDTVIDRFDNIGQVLDAHIDSIADLEEHKNEITKKVEVIDQAPEKINDKI